MATGVYEICREISERKAGMDGAKMRKKLEQFEEKRAQIHQLEWQMSHLHAEWKEKEIRCQNLMEQCSDLRENDSRRKLKERLDALVMAEEILVRTAKETSDNTSRWMNDRASAIFSEITDGRYLSLEIGVRDSGISVWDGVRRIPAERLSRGTLEQIYFSIRMAASDMVLEEPMPVILDDAFAFYDDKRLESVIKWLSRQEKQGIILSCHSREKEMLERMQNL